MSRTRSAGELSAPHRSDSTVREVEEEACADSFTGVPTLQQSIELLQERFRNTLISEVYSSNFQK